MVRPYLERRKVKLENRKLRNFQVESVTFQRHFELPNYIVSIFIWDFPILGGGENDRVINNHVTKRHVDRFESILNQMKVEWH